MRIETILRELTKVIDGAESSAAGAGGRSLAMPKARFEQCRREAVVICAQTPGALVAALQIESATWDQRGARRIVDLLRRVAHDLQERAARRSRSYSALRALSP